MALPVRKIIVRLRMWWADLRGHHGKRWNYEPGDTIWVAIRTKEEHNHPKPPILLGYFNPFSACNCTECMIVYSYMTNKNTNKTFNVCYLREYLDPEHQGEFFYSYETVYRNVPVKYKSKFNDKDEAKDS